MLNIERLLRNVIIVMGLGLILGSSFNGDSPVEEISPSPTIFKYEVYDVLGKEVFRCNDSTKIALLSNGVYLVKTKSERINKVVINNP